MVRFACVGLLLITTGCTVVQGSGVSASETRTLTGFHSVKNTTFTDVQINADAADYNIVVQCDDNLLEDLKMQVDDGVLRIFTAPILGFINANDCSVDIDMPQLLTVHNSGSGDVVSTGGIVALEEASSSGSGDIFIDGVDTAFLDIHSSGSGGITVCGSAAAITVSNSGSGTIDAECLPTAEAELRASGSGDLHATVDGPVSVRLSGSGSAHVHGDSVIVEERTSGSGDLVIYD